MPSKLQKAIGAVKDQTSISLAKVSNNTSSNLEVAVLKATTHDAVPIEEKYIYEVLQLVSSNKVHATACARAIGKRIGRTRNWVVALKSLMLILRIFQDGDPYFPREILHAMKRGAKILNLSSFRDDSNSSPWDFTAFVRTFALYLDERLECFLTGKLQRRYTQDTKSGLYQRSKSRGARGVAEPVREMKPAMLLDKISYWQRLLERAIATRPTGAAKTNRLVQISLYAIVQESFDLYKDISDGLALLLDSFFHLQYQNCVSAFQTCVKAAKQFEELSGFYSLCKGIGVGRSSEYPSVNKISEELIETLQEFLKDQTSFSSNARATNRNSLLPGPRSSRHDSFGKTFETPKHRERNSDFGSQCTSLEELISATETGANAPAISIDLEAYSPTQHDESFRISDSGSTRSLPVSNSMADIMSVGDWAWEQEVKDEQPKEQKQETPKPVLDSSTSKNWELELVQAISTIPTPTESSQTHSPNESNTFNAFQGQPTVENQSQTLSENTSNTFNTFQDQPTIENPSQTLSDNTSNTFNAFQDQPQIENSSQTLSDNTSNTSNATNWELVLFESASQQQPQAQNQLAPNTITPQNNHYNPFLDDLAELSNGVPLPTFQDAPTFSVQNQDEDSLQVSNENDPFADIVSSDEMLSSSSSINQQQQLWLQNQNKIISKYLS